MEPASDDDEYEPNGGIVCGLLCCDESSMNGSSLFDAIFSHSHARHTVLIGDVRQLQPIGSGKPFQDAIASDAVPVTWLNRNYRTNSVGIRALCEDIKDGKFIPDDAGKYEALGGVEFLRCDRSAKAGTASEIYADHIHSGCDPYQLAILTPHNVGDGGTRVINLAVRKALDLPDEKIVKGDMLLVTANNYKAPKPDGSGEEIIRNGERCTVTAVGPKHDFFDVKFPKNFEGRQRCIRFLTKPNRRGSIPVGPGAEGQRTAATGWNATRFLPPGIDLGYAFSVHKAQGSQFSIVIAIAEPGTKVGGIVQRSSIYTACSRAKDRLIVLGNMDDFTKAASTPDIERDTLLLELLKRKDAQYSAPRRPLPAPDAQGHPIVKIGTQVTVGGRGAGTIIAVRKDKGLGIIAGVKFDDEQVSWFVASSLKGIANSGAVNGEHRSEQFSREAIRENCEGCDG